jgi:hypothetical protein
MSTSAELRLHLRGQAAAPNSARGSESSRKSPRFPVPLASIRRGRSPDPPAPVPHCPSIAAQMGDLEDYFPHTC